jgi:TatD DNase family protein
MLIDTHAHLYSSQFDSDRDAMMQRTLESGVEMVLLPNIDLASIGPMHKLEDSYSKHLRAMMGLHPGSVAHDWQEVLALIKPWFKKRSYVAVGEIGIDLYWRQDNLEAQKGAFLTQVDWALSYDLPVVIHSRESCSLILDLLGNLPVKGVFHCFTGSVEEAHRIVDRGMYLGIGGVLTYKANEALREVYRKINPNRVVVETDSPYLAPVPNRGKRNESTFVHAVINQLAALWSLTPEQVVLQTGNNAQKLFSL